jgi:hypothetical protein
VFAVEGIFKTLKNKDVFSRAYTDVLAAVLKMACGASTPKVQTEHRLTQL